MTFTVRSYATFDKTAELKPYELERRDPLPEDVQIKILYAGICHSDIHLAKDDWGWGVNYPLVPGHEIVGVVEKVGGKVKDHQVGDVVAVGCMVDSCHSCTNCEKKFEQFCPKVEFTYGSEDQYRPGNGTAGGYSEKIVVNDHFVAKVPKALQTPELLPGVAPILCAGITVFAPMLHTGLKRGQKLAVVGLGGLGHMAVKLGSAIGADVTVISRSHKKDNEAKALGAQHVIASTSEEEFNPAKGTFDLVIDTIPFGHDVNPYIELLAPYGTISAVGHLGVFSEPVNNMLLIMGNRSLHGSAIGTMKETQELLDFCAEHKVIAAYKMITMENVNDAWTEISKGDTADRFIIDIKKFAEEK